MAPLTKLQTDLQSLTKDFLRFWMVDIHQERHSQKSASQKGHRCTRPVHPETEAGTVEGRRLTEQGESALVKLLAA